MKQPTPEVLKKLTDKHIKRFEDRIKASRDPKSLRAIRERECLYYLGLWQSIAHKRYEWDKMSDIEKKEVREAIASGEANGL